MTATAPTAAGGRAERPKLTDLINQTSLQQMQDAFVDVTGLNVLIRDAGGQPVTAPTDLDRRRATHRFLEQLIDPLDVAADPSTAPIVVDESLLGSITLTGPVPAPQPSPGAAAVQFLQLLAHAIARLCTQTHHLSRRVDELTALYQLSRVLAAHRDLDQVLKTGTQQTAAVLGVKAVSIRLLDPDTQRLVPRAGYDLSQDYLDDSSVMLRGDCELFHQAMDDQVITIGDLCTDPNVHHPEAARREGLVSMLCIGLIFQKRGLGVIQLFTGTAHDFTGFEIDLVKAIARLLATAIHSSRLEQQRNRRRTELRQLRLAADVQRRMLPRAMPRIPPFDIAARYVPSLEVSGDFYDLINLDGHLGVAIGDVVGKGVAAGLLMASVRTALRAFAQDLYHLDHVIARVNNALERDTIDREFATLFYGVLDPRRLRLTYCNAGHDPPMLLRDGAIQYLDVGGMMVGVSPDHRYDKAVIELQAGDLLLLHSDGLSDTLNFQQQRFGRDRIESALRQTAALNAEAAMGHILWQMRCFTGLNDPTDDTTVVVIKVGR